MGEYKNQFMKKKYLLLDPTIYYWIQPMVLELKLANYLLQETLKELRSLAGMYLYGACDPPILKDVLIGD